MQIEARECDYCGIFRGVYFWANMDSGGGGLFSCLDCYWDYKAGGLGARAGVLSQQVLSIRQGLKAWEP